MEAETAPRITVLRTTVAAPCVAAVDTAHRTIALRITARPAAVVTTPLRRITAAVVGSTAAVVTPVVEAVTPVADITKLT